MGTCAIMTNCKKIFDGKRLTYGGFKTVVLNVHPIGENK